MKRIAAITTILTFIYSTLYASSTSISVKKINIKKHPEIYAELQNKFPNSLIIEGNSEMIRKIESDPSLINGVKKIEIPVSNIDDKKSNNQGEVKGDDSKAAKKQKETSKIEMPDFDIPNLNLGNIDDPNALLIIFAVIGAVVIIVMFAYGIAYLYKFINSSKLWVDLRVTSNFIYGKDELEGREVTRKGVMSGFKTALGAGEKCGLGLNAEFGYLNIDEEFSDGDLKNYEGFYFLTGPVFFAGDINKTRVSLEILAGTCTSEDLGLISVARLNLLHNFDNFQIGISGGAFYYDVPESEVVIDKTDRITYSGGITLGWSF